MVSRREFFPEPFSVSVSGDFIYIGLTFFKTYDLQLRCRSYATGSSKPCSVKVPTRCCDAPWPHRYPFAETVFSGATQQPYIHDCLVTLFEGKKIHYFCIFFKKHARLPVNQSTPELEAASFRGEAVVTRSSDLHRTSVNMRGRDAKLADFIMTK